MNRRTAAVGLLMVFLVFEFTSFSALCAEKGKSAKGSAPAPTAKNAPPLQAAQPTAQKTPPAAAPELNAAIERIFVKGKRVFVALARTGSGKIAPEDFPKIMLRIQTSKGHRQWSLAEVDKTRALGGGPGKMEFDTGIVLEKGETVKGILSLGKIEKPRHDMLVIASATALRPAPAAAKPMGTMAGKMSRPQTGRPTPVPMIFDRGIRITTPVAGEKYYQGEPVTVQYRWTNTSSPSGNIEISIQSEDQTWNYANTTVPAAASGTVTLTPPGTMRSGRYTVVAYNRESDAFGRSDAFEVGQNSARIDFISPATGDVVHPGSDVTMRYKLNRRVEPGTITFRIAHAGVVTEVTQEYRPPAPGANPLPEYTFVHHFPDTAATGEYGIIATHPKASGIGNLFSVQPRYWGTPHGVRINIDGNPPIIFCDTAYTARLELTDPASPAFYVPSAYYPGGSRQDSLWVHLTSEGRGSMGRWMGAGWEAGSLTRASDGRSMTGRFSVSCNEATSYVLTFNHTAEIYGDSTPFAIGSGPASLTVDEPGRGGEHFVRRQEHPVRWKYHPLVTETSLPSRWNIEFYSFDIATGATSLAYTLRSSATCTEDRRAGSRIYSCETTWNTRHVPAGTYKVKVVGGGASDWGSLAFSVGNAGSYDLSINRIYWDGASNQLMAEVNNPDHISGAIDFEVMYYGDILGHGRAYFQVPTVFPSSGETVQIGLGKPGPLAGSDRWSKCPERYKVTIDHSNRVDERDETNNSISAMVGPSSLIRFEAITFDASQQTWYRSLSASPPSIDWDNHGNGNTAVLMLDVNNCGSSTVRGWVSISQEGCCILPTSGSGGRLCSCPEDYGSRAIRARDMEIAPGTMQRIEVSQGDLVHMGGTTIVLSFTGDLATYAPANPVRINLDY